MTEKSLSQKICEVCGIKPSYKVKHFNGITEVWSPAFNKEELRFAKAQKQIFEQKEVYPNFENNNNNKLKLLEIISQYSMTCVYLQDMFPIENAIKYCLNVLNDTRYTYSARKKLKQAIREEKWDI